MGWRFPLFGIREWLDRQKTMKELQAYDLDTFHNELHNIDPLGPIRASLQAGNRAEAQRKFDEALARHPTLVRKSRESINILLDLNDLVNAEALIAAWQKRFPRTPLYAEGYAMVAERRQDFVEAVRRWRDVRRRFPGIWKSYEREAACLRLLSKYDEAEAAIDRALVLFSQNIHCRIEWARIAEQREDWDLALHRWEWLAKQYPQATGALGMARALHRLGKADESLKLLVATQVRHPKDGDVNAEIAWRRRQSTAGRKTSVA